VSKIRVPAAGHAGILSVMKDTTSQRTPAYAGFVAVAVLVTALVFIGGGCGDDTTSEVTAVQGGSTMTTAQPALPPIDLLAPASFETASFALG